MATVDQPKRFDRKPPSGQILDREPPQSLEAERAVLGSIMLLPEACDDVALILRPDDFAEDAHARIYELIIEMHDSGTKIDPTLLVQRLKDSGQFEAIGGGPYLAQIWNEVSTAAHAEHYAKIVYDKSVLRSLIHASTDILREAYDPTVDSRSILGQAEEKIFSILDKKSQGNVNSIREVLNETMERIDARMKNDHAFGGLETGLTDFDEMTGGLHGSELLILAARPSMGKTALALNMVEHIAIDNGNPALFVSLEMASLELADRLLCSRAQVNGHQLRAGKLSAEDSQKLVEVASEMSSAPLFIDDSPSRTMTEISAAARRIKRQHGLSVIVIDYLQLIDPDNPRDPRQEQVSRIARRLKGLARELNVPVLCLAQLNRQVESTKDNKPQLTHLRESGAIEQDADVVMFVHRDEYYENDEQRREEVRGEADLLIRKQRNGPTGDVKLTWLHDFTRFTNAAPKPYDEFD